MKRRGGILFEAVVATLLLSLLVGASAQLLMLMQRQSRLLDQRATAIQECHLALRSLAELPASEFDASKLSDATLPREATGLLPEAKLELFAEPGEEPKEGVRLRAKVLWRPTSSSDFTSVELNCWRFDLPPAGDRPGGTP